MEQIVAGLIAVSSFFIGTVQHVATFSIDVCPIIDAFGFKADIPGHLQGSLIGNVPAPAQC